MNASLCVGFLLCVAADKPTPVKPDREWAGSSANEAMQSISPPFLTTAEGFGIIWKAWGITGDIPAVDFNDDVVVVSVGKGSVLKTSYSLTDAGDLQVAVVATKDLKPGFRYVLAVVPRAGVARIDGKPLPASAAEEPPAPTAVRYVPGVPLSGKLTISGSATMSHLAALWGEAFAKHHPKLKTAVDADGTEEALADLSRAKPNETVIIAVSRPVPPSELAALSTKHGKKILSFPVCEDDIAVIVHPANPVASLSPAQLKSLYTTPAGQLTWSALGVPGVLAAKTVSLHGRDANSGTKKFLRTLAVGEDGPEPATHTHTSYRKLIEAVAADPAAIGYARGHNHGDTVKAVPIGPLKDGGTKPYIRRPCFVIVAVADEKQLPSAVREFLLFVYRFDGQSLLFRDGFDPLPKDTITAELARLGVEDNK